MAASKHRVVYKGVTFDSIRKFLFNMYFYEEDMLEEEAELCLKENIVPMQHNFENPLQRKDAGDTFILFWISRDEKITQDHNNSEGSGHNVVAKKLAEVDVRFVGVEAETWAKAFHHLTKRDPVAYAMMELCQGTILEHIGDIIPVNIDYYGVGNSSIAFDVSFKVEYKESMQLNWAPLESISFDPGEITVASE